MRRVRAWLAVVFVLAFTGAGYVRAARPQHATESAGNGASHRALLDRYCVTCHSQRTKTAGLVLEAMPLDQLSVHAEVWEKVIRKLRGGMMPPQGLPRPDNATIDGFVRWLESSIDRETVEKPNPGRASLHRLNRTEYQNAVRDYFDDLKK